MNSPSRTPGICRIDQAEKRTHGFFVRLQRAGKIHSAFFPDKKHGGQAEALTAAQEHYRQLTAKLGTSARMSRRQWAELRRGKSRSGIVGVRYVVVRRKRRVGRYWLATWSPEPYTVGRKMFSVRRHGARKAKQMALRARRAGLANMAWGPVK